MALGVEKNWRKAFQGILTQPPEWYRGSSYGPGFYPMMFANDLSSMSTRASTVMTSAPRSSGGSGFGGGGSSGGGFGGGGGGGVLVFSMVLQLKTERLFFFFCLRPSGQTAEH